MVGSSQLRGGALRATPAWACYDNASAPALARHKRTGSGRVLPSCFVRHECCVSTRRRSPRRVISSQVARHAAAVGPADTRGRYANMPPRRAPSSSPALSYADSLSALWFALDAFTHFAIEGSYLALALGPTAAKSSSLFGAIWREYGNADRRWAGRDPTVISLELLTVFGGGPAAAALVYAIVKCVRLRVHPCSCRLFVTLALRSAVASRGATWCRRCFRWQSCTAAG